MSRRILSTRRRAAPSAITGAPANQTTSNITDALNVVGTVSSASPIEWVYSQDNGTNWTVFNPTGAKVRDLVFRLVFNDDFNSLPSTTDWDYATGGGLNGNGIWDSSNIAVNAAVLEISGKTDASSGVKTGKITHKRKQVFGRYEAYLWGDIDATNTFGMSANTWNDDNNGLGLPGGGINFAGMYTSLAATRIPVKGYVRATNDGTTLTPTEITFGTLNGSIDRQYICEWSPGRIDFYAGGVLQGSVVDSPTTPIPKHEQKLQLQVYPATPTYSGADIKFHVAYVQVSELVPIPILVRARLVSNPTVVSPTATLTVTGASNQVVFTTDLPPTSTRALNGTVNITATWTPSGTFQVEERSSSSAAWVNSSGVGSTGTGTTTTFGASVLAVNGKQYRVKVTAGGYSAFSTTTTMDAPTAPPSSSLIYAWENRPAYVEPNPNAAAGTPEKLLATSLGITSRITAANQTELNSAISASTAGTQIYITSTITGDGTWRVIDWAGKSGTESNPIVFTCAPGVWLDGGLALGSQNLDSRGVYITTSSHVWLYGVNVRNANFLAMYNTCSGTATKPILVRYCNFQNSGHSMLALAGNFGSGGSSSYIDVRYNIFNGSGYANQEFGEAVYVGYGSTNSPTLQANHHMTIEANYFTNLTAEACDQKAGSYAVFFRYNLIENCGDRSTPNPRAGNALNVGFPGAFQQPGHTTPPVGWNAQSEVIGNRWHNCTSGQTKFPDGLILFTSRGFKVVGNLIQNCNVGSAGIIVFYLDGNVPTDSGDNGTSEVHNNTIRNCFSMNATYRISNAGASQPTLFAKNQANSNASNNVRENSASATTGANYTVSSTDFTDDGSGNTGAASAPAPSGALNVTGTDTTAHWTKDYANKTVIAPVKPGARQ